MSAPTPAIAGTCWNCGKALQARADACLWCGAALAAGAGTPAPAAPTAAVATAIPTVAAAHAPRSAGPLGEAFAGSPAPTGPRLAAFTLDVLLIASLGAALQLTVGAVALTAAAVIDALVLLWVLEARTGLTPGHALFRIRVSRVDRPASPGAVRSLVRAGVTGAGLVVGVVGAWLIVATSAWDASGRRRSWADAAAGTQAVTAPRTREQAVAYHAPRIDLDASTPDAVALPYATSPRGEAPQGLPSGPPLPVRTSEDSASAPGTAPAHARAQAEPQHRPSALPLPATAPPGPSAPPAAQPTPVQQPASAPEPEQAATGALLLVLDTGQREQLPLPAAAVLGRRPEGQESRDTLITVTDPERTVSKSHLRIEHVDGQTWLTDLGSANGTWLIDEFGESRQAFPQQRLAVDFGTRVRVGERMLTVHVLGAEEATS